MKIEVGVLFVQPQHFLEGTGGVKSFVLFLLWRFYVHIDLNDEIYPLNGSYAFRYC